MNKRQLRRLLPRHWNRRPFTWCDFEFFCGLDGVHVYDADMEREGFYCVFLEQPCIFISRTVKTNKRLWVAFHELAHHWLHPASVHWFRGFDIRAEAQAEIVASCALLPEYLILSKKPHEIIEEFGYPPELVELRLRIYQQDRI